MKKKKGFTLVELLVVIAIIGLLSTLAFISLNNARSKARDAKRVSDVRQIQSALELYYNNQTTPAYPSATTFENITGITELDITFPDAPSEDCSTADYNYTGYQYQSTDANNQSYELIFCLKGATGGLAAGARTASETGIN